MKNVTLHFAKVKLIRKQCANANSHALLFYFLKTQCITTLFVVVNSISTELKNLEKKKMSKMFTC